MRVGVFTVIFSSMKLDQVLDYLASLGVQAVEIGTGGYPGDSHCPVDELLKSPRRAREYMQAIASRGMIISSLSCHGNPLHPDRAFAAKCDAIFRKTVRLASLLEVEVVTTFSGCPGDGPRARQPNWVTCAWPPEYLEVLAWQWEKVALPYWRKAAAFCQRYGMRQVALEMHPGFLVYHPESLLRLRREIGHVIGANFDPSHLFWQGIDPCAAVRALEGAIYHVHAKDLALQQWNARINGVLDTKHYREEKKRSWIFRTVGYGNSRHFWCELVSTLRMNGYDGALSLEHEDSLMTPKEGLEKGLRFLQGVVLTEPKGCVTWA